MTRLARSLSCTTVLVLVICFCSQLRYQTGTENGTEDGTEARQEYDAHTESTTTVPHAKEDRQMETLLLNHTHRPPVTKPSANPVINLEGRILTTMVHLMGSGYTLNDNLLVRENTMIL